MENKNAIHEMTVYRVGKVWYFDDVEKGIQREPFVAGASEMIEALVQAKYGDVPMAQIIFSETFIPDADVFLTCTEKVYPLKYTGKSVWNTKAKKHLKQYVSDETQPAESAFYVDENGNRCWLCPAQLAFFSEVAETIYVKLL